MTILPSIFRLNADVSQVRSTAIASAQQAA